MHILATATPADPAPWWGIPVIAGSFLVAVAFITFGANLLLKKMELARGDRAKWDDDILASSIALKGIYGRMAAVGTVGNEDYEDDVRDRLPTYKTCLEEMTPHIEKLTLIGSEKLSNASGMLMLSAMRQGLDVDNSHLNKKERKHLEKNMPPTLSQASKDFSDAVRRELRARK